MKIPNVLTEPRKCETENNMKTEEVFYGEIFASSKTLRSAEGRK